MKVLFILHIPPPVHGAAVVGGLIKDSRVINDCFHCRYINLGLSSTVKDIRRHSLRKSFKYLSLLFQVTKQVIVFRPKLCYLTPTAYGIGFYKDLLIIAIVKLFGSKVVIHYHTKGVKFREDKFFDDLLYRFVFRNTYEILLSKHLYPDIQKYVSEDKVYFCSNGIPDLCGDEKSHGYFIRKNQKQHTEILFLSNLIESKGVLVLIEACRNLRNRGLNFHCTIAGNDGELINDRVSMIVKENGLSDFVFISGAKHGNDKILAFYDSDIFVLPTFYSKECMPLVLLEAMQFSLPIISTYEGAIPYVVENDVTGFLIPQKNIDALTDKLEILIKNPELRLRMGNKGRLKYEREFTLGKFEKRMVEILAKIESD
jgi:glycosyltransferase involved in cell wall biosynthesis